MGIDFWDSATLGDLLGDNVGGLAKFISDSQALLGGDLSKVTATLSSIQARVTAVQNLLNTATSILGSLNSSGFYIIYLSPGSGNWISRLTGASGAPDNLGFAAGMCAIAKAPSFSGVQTKYTDMINVLTTPITW
jgi:hypothetical protein